MLKNILSIRTKLYLSYLFSKETERYRDIPREKKKVIVALAADYGNLGDVAITYAQEKYLEKLFPERVIIDFPISDTFLGMKSLKKIVTSEDIITIVGGGNTGDMYDDIQYCREFIIDQFPENRIFSFPQTIDFSEGESGKKALEKARRVYSRHKKLILTAREEKSFHKFQQEFPKNRVIFTPDIVLSMKRELPPLKREGITLCFRSDGEKKISENLQKEFIEKLEAQYKITHKDTHIDRNKMSLQEREKHLEEIWDTFKRSRLVITDRLHGMIFCAITGTPCIALDNSNKKISGVYRAWLKDADFIRMLDTFDLEKLEEYKKELLEKEIKNNSPDLEGTFEILEKELLYGEK